MVLQGSLSAQLFNTEKHKSFVTLSHHYKHANANAPKCQTCLHVECKSISNVRYADTVAVLFQDTGQLILRLVVFVLPFALAMFPHEAYASARKMQENKQFSISIYLCLHLHCTGSPTLFPGSLSSCPQEQRRRS